MNFKVITFCIIVSLAINCSAAPSKKKGKTFYFDGLTKGFTLSRVGEENQAQPANGGYQVRFVPLISLLAGMFPSIMNRLGQFTGVNKVAATTNTNNRRFGVADKLETSTSAPLSPPVTEAAGSTEAESEEEDGDDDYQEKELIECDGNHLGLWPDRTDPQRYYKCEVDPRTSPTMSCIREMINKDTGKEIRPMERIEVPGVKPCYLLSMLKCANGFKYQHSTRICVPDIVFGQRH